MQAMHDAEKILIDESIICPIYWYVQKVLINDNLIGNIASGKETKLNKHLYYAFSKENYDIAANFMEDNTLQYIYEEEYKKVNHELSELHDEFENAPKKYKEKFQRFEALQVMNNLYENSFIYQYFKNKMNK